jgi:hypothetical protein
MNSDNGLFRPKRKISVKEVKGIKSKMSGSVVVKTRKFMKNPLLSRRQVR